MDAKQLYDQAYKLHYMDEDPQEALALYNQIIEEFPNSQEAKNSKSQIEQAKKMSNQQSKRKQIQTDSSSDYEQTLKEKYPALRFIASIYKFLAVFIVIVAIILIIIGMGGDQNVGLIAGALLGGFLGAVTMLAMAEGIKVFVDMEEDLRRIALKLENNK